MQLPISSSLYSSLSGKRGKGFNSNLFKLNFVLNVRNLVLLSNQALLVLQHSILGASVIKSKYLARSSDSGNAYLNSEGGSISTVDLLVLTG